MKRSTGLLALSLICLAAVPAQAQSNVSFYATPSVAYGFLGDFKSTVGASFAFGASFKGNHSVEAEVAWFDTKSDVEYGYKLQVLPIVLTYKYSLAFANRWTGYAGFSAGLAHESASYYGYNHSDEGFTFGPKIGVVWTLTDKVSFDFGGTVLRITKTDITTDGNIEYLTAGVKFKF